MEAETEKTEFKTDTVVCEKREKIYSIESLILGIAFFMIGYTITELDLTNKNVVALLKLVMLIAFVTIFVNSCFLQIFAQSLLQRVRIAFQRINPYKIIHEYVRSEFKNIEEKLNNKNN